MRRWRFVLVTLAVLTTGCSGVVFEETRPTTPTADGPPGVGTDGLNASALVAAHERSLAGVPVAIETTRSRWDTLGRPNETVTTRMKSDGDGTLWRRTVSEIGAEQSHVERWDDGPSGLRYDADTGRVAVDDIAPSPTDRYQTRQLREWFVRGTYEVRALGPPNARRYVLTATQYTPLDGRPVEADTVRFESRAVVTARGRVLAMSASLATVERNRWGRQVRSRSYTYRVARTGGVTPSRPAWHPQRETAVADG
jgi:hypothetical protein